MTLRVSDVDAVSGLLQSNGVAFEQADGDILVGPDVASGTSLIFTESPPA